RQALARPRRIGRRLVEADMRDRLGRINGPHAVQREKLFSAGLPIERAVPGLLPRQCPAIGEPKLGPRVSAVGDEFEIFAAGDEPRRDPERLYRDGVHRALIVEGEALAAIADLDLAARMR